MACYVIDAPPLLQLEADGVEVHGSHQLLRPTSSARRLWPSCSLLSRNMTEHAELALHERMTALKMRLLGDRVSRRTAWKVATEQNCLFAAEYVAVCMLQADALVTVDKAMASRATGLVPLARYSALFADA